MSLAKGLVAAGRDRADRRAVASASAPHRVACIGGPAHAREMVHEGAGLVAASDRRGARPAASSASSSARAWSARSPTTRSGVELAGAAKNAAALAAGATEAQGLNAAGAAAGHIFAEVWRFAERQGARPESLIGLAGTGDLVATALAPQSRNRRAGELLADGRAGRGDPGAHRPGGRGAGVRAAAGAALERAGVERAGHGRAWRA